MNEINHIIELISQGMRSEALQKIDIFLKKRNGSNQHFEKLINLKARLSSIEKEVRDRHISSQDARVANNNLTSSIIHFISELKSDSALFEFHDVEKNKRAIIKIQNAYTCNRQEQVIEFEKKFIRSSNSKVDAYIIYGDEEQSPIGMYSRLCENEIKFFVEEIEYLSEPMSINPHDDLEISKIKFLRSLFEALRFNTNRLNIASSSINDLYSSPLFKDKDCMVLGIKIYSRHWNETALELLSWFINDYCSSIESDNNPKIIFFFQLNFTKEKEKKNLFSFFKKDKLQAIEDSINSIDFIKKLPKLMPIDVTDINIWLDNITHNSENKKKFIKQHFGDKTSYNMDFVLTKLKKIINTHNQTVNQ